jgi:hypothetical protein
MHVPNEIIGTFVLKLQQMKKFFYLFSKSASLSLIWCTNMTRQLKIFVYSLSTYRLSVLNTDPKHDSLHVHWHPSCEEIVSKYHVLQVTFVYTITTFILTVWISASNMTCSN